MPYKNYIYEYYAKISSGEIIVGKWIKKIFEIIINGLQTQEYFFNAKAANKAIKFIETFCHHSKGRNDLITLELWQKAIVSTIFGIQDAEKIRVFREIFIVIGRKNGKSLFASALIAYMAYLEPEYGQEIYKDVFNWYVWLLETYGIRVLKIGYDRYSAQYLVDDLKNYGFHTDDVYQGENLTPVIREFEGIIKDGDFKIANNKLLQSHFLNVALKHNMETRKFRPIKIEQRAHIDGFVSVIDAMTVRQKYHEEVGELLKNAA